MQTTRGGVGQAKTPTLAAGTMVFPRQLGSGWPRKVVFSPCDTGTLARLVKLAAAAAAAVSVWGKRGGGQETRVLKQVATV